MNESDPHDDALADRLARELPASAHLDGGPTLAQVRARSRRRRWRPPVVAAGLAVAATALFALDMAPPTSRDRGTAGLPDGAVALEAFAEGPDGVRALTGGSPTVAPDERVLFRLRAARPGHLALREGSDDGAPWVLPPTAVGAGHHTPGGATPHTWRPDQPLDTATYQALLCPEAPGTDGVSVPAGCARAALTLRWAW